ncbi:MAG TPA: phosphate ABC transporter permease subunit PstC [Acidimicrobiales bacterium]|nr:phosphate ABC transporter permease subunit PstC [Acidimicrobiales bacterium]
MTATTIPVPVEPPATEARNLDARPDRGDKIFRRGVTGSGVWVLALMVAVGVFLTAQATKALAKTGFSFITTSEWQPDRQHFGIASVLTFTVLIAVVAVAVAIPLSLGTALFITEIVPAKLRSIFVAAVDLMAAVPSIVYGLWGLKFLEGKIVPIARWLSAWLGWIPIFHVSGAEPHSPLATASVYTASTFIAGVVVAMMVIPIQCSVMREVFSQVPAGEREGALALGSTRWGMIRIVSLPFGQGGIIGGTMLGLGRALGETIAVLLIISPRFDITFHLLEAGSNSVSSLIASRYGDASGFGLSALFAAGLALFLMTLGVNFVASIFIARSRSGAESEA